MDREPRRGLPGKLPEADRSDGRGVPASLAFQHLEHCRAACDLQPGAGEGQQRSYLRGLSIDSVDRPWVEAWDVRRKPSCCDQIDARGIGIENLFSCLSHLPRVAPWEHGGPGDCERLSGKHVVMPCVQSELEQIWESLETVPERLGERRRDCFKRSSADAANKSVARFGKERKRLWVLPEPEGEGSRGSYTRSRFCQRRPRCISLTSQFRGQALHRRRRDHRDPRGCSCGTECRTADGQNFPQFRGRAYGELRDDKESGGKGQVSMDVGHRLDAMDALDKSLSAVRNRGSVKPRGIRRRPQVPPRIDRLSIIRRHVVRHARPSHLDDTKMRRLSERPRSAFD